MSISKIEIVEFKNEWNGPNGVVYYHKVRFENGEEGQIGTKEKLPAKLAVGTEHDFTITDGKIKINQPLPAGVGYGNNTKTPFKSEPFEHKAAGFAMSYAKDLVIADAALPISAGIDLIKQADIIYSWLMTKKQG